MPRPARIVVIAAHPQRQVSHVNRALADAAAALAAQGAGVELHDLYRLYPDYLIDVEAEQAALAAAQLVVWLHPIHWYAPPPLMKLWIDDVLAFGWAYGPESGSGHALRGKDLWLVASTGGSAHSYSPEGHNHHPFADFLVPYDETASVVGMRWLPPLVLHGAHKVDPATLAAHVQAFVQRLKTWPDWPELAGLTVEAGGDVPADERPETSE